MRRRPILLPALAAALTACGLLNLGGPAPTPVPTTPLPIFAPPAALPTPAPLPDIPSARTLPDPAGYAWHLVAEGFDRPVGLAHAGDGSGRIFILEQPGLIRILENGTIKETPFLDIRARVGDDENEQGLLGIAFHPNYPQNGYFFLNYTDTAGDTVIARYRVSADPNIADPATETRLLGVRQPFANHNGGGLAFGPDGCLYIGLGDGGAADDPQGNAQDLKTHLGKMLRLDVDTSAPYSIPPGNPFPESKKPEIWAYGLRNPWRFAFDRLTGDLYIGDVGQNKWEEIDFLPANSPGGANFGWDYREGFHEFEGNPPASLALTEPVAEYGRDDGCSVTGGEVYRGRSLPAWYGVYLYGDFCSGRVWGLLRGEDGVWQTAQLFKLDTNISAFGLDETGEIYLLDLGGSVYLLGEK